MKHFLQTKRLGNLTAHRNLLMGVVVFLSLVVFLQAGALFFKSEKIIIHPAETKQSYWIEGNTFSPTYMEEMGFLFAHLLLDVSEANCLYNADVLLRYGDPNTYGDLKQKLFETHEKLKSENLSTTFVVTNSTIYPDLQAVDLTGQFSQFVAGKRIKEEKITYRLTFTSTKGRLFLKGFKKWEESDDQ